MPLFGDASRFAVSCEALPPQPPASHGYGHIVLHVGGAEIGDWDHVEWLDGLADQLLLTPPVSPSDAEFVGKSDAEILDKVYHPSLGLSQRLSHFLICPGGVPAFDGWYLVRTRRGDHESLVWRRWGEAEARSTSLACSEYETTVRSFLEWLNGFKAAEP